MKQISLQASAFEEQISAGSCLEAGKHFYDKGGYTGTGRFLNAGRLMGMNLSFRIADCAATERFPVAKTEETTPPSTNSQISMKPEGDVFVAGSDSSHQLLALCHAAVSDSWYLEGRFRELIAPDPAP